jgi:hypothetical protein
LRHPHFEASAITLLALRFAGAAIVLVLPTALMGGTLPVMVAAVARKIEELGVRAGFTRSIRPVLLRARSRPGFS